VVTQLKHVLRTRATDSSDVKETTVPDRAHAIRQSTLKNAEGRFLKAMKRTAKGEMGLQVLTEYLDELDQARERATTTYGFLDVSEKLSQWDTLQPQERRELIAENLEKVMVADERVEVVA
jgi:hypothetical protein